MTSTYEHVDYQPILKALHASGSPMSVDEIRRAAACTQDPKDILSKLVYGMYAYSPIARVKKDSYRLADWARAAMDAGEIPPYPLHHDHALPSTPITPQRQEELIEAMAGFLNPLPEAILSVTKGTTKVSYFNSIIQAFSAAHYDLVKDIAPRDLFDLLDLAFMKVDQDTGGRRYVWLSNEFPVPIRRRRVGLTFYFIHILNKPFSELLRLLQLCLDVPGIPERQVVLVPQTLDRVAQLVQGNTRIYLSAPGETITVRQVGALHLECAEGEKARLYILGRISSGATEMAQKLGVELVNRYHTTSMLSMIED